ncbi:MAG: hypothetical protein H7Z19_12495, partial [Chitinophagaceae bacterium]|nr:hypothetical protein [Rubrivivax sp.]
MTAQIPSDDQAQASRAVLLDVLTILGLYLDGIVVIGGWVPELTFPGRGHVGSFDVDLALLRKRLAPDQRRQVLQDARYASDWIAEVA